MAQKIVTEGMKAHAELWLARSKTWVRGTRKRDGLAFVIFPSSRHDDDNLPVGYYATETACSCRGFFHRGVCSHQLAVREEARQARAAVGPRRASYDALFTDDVLGLTSAF